MLISKRAVAPATTEVLISGCFCCNFKPFSQSSYHGYYQGGGACSLDPLTADYGHKGWIKVAAGVGEFQKSLGCGMCVEIRGQGILAKVADGAKKSETPIIGPIYAFVIDRCENCQKGKVMLTDSP